MTTTALTHSMTEDGMAAIDAALEGAEVQGPSLTGAVGRKCRPHMYAPTFRLPTQTFQSAVEAADFNDSATLAVAEPVWACTRCGTLRDETRAKRGRQSRNYGNRAELSASRKYGGVKVGHAGGPVDIRGKDWNTQVKTHRRLPPREWTKAFAAMSASRERLPRLLLRFLPGPGLPPIDYFVVPAGAWLDWFGRDEAAGDERR